MTSREREEIMFRMNRELEQISLTPDTNDSFFSQLTTDNQLQTKFKLWRQNMTIPLTDQLKERAERKIEEAKEASFAAQNADQAFFKQPGDSD